MINSLVVSAEGRKYEREHGAFRHPQIFKGGEKSDARAEFMAAS